MAKFKNLVTKTGKVNFGDQKIEFRDFLETEHKALIEYLRNHDYWEEIKETKQKTKQKAKVVDNSKDADLTASDL